ncbi:MAG: hypothetical protein AB1689_19870, partial [Thermodesulfobacteriota bacterium]
ALVRWLPAPRPVLAGTLATAVLVVLAAGALRRGSGGSSEHYAVLFEGGARTVLPWLEHAARTMKPEERVVVPLWFQPAALWKLGGASVVAAEVAVARPEDGGRTPDWILLAPAYYETPAAAAWAGEAASSGYDVVATSALPRMSLVRRADGAGAQPVAHAAPRP